MFWAPLISKQRFRKREARFGWFGLLLRIKASGCGGVRLRSCSVRLLKGPEIEALGLFGVGGLYDTNLYAYNHIYIYIYIFMHTHTHMLFKHTAWRVKVMQDLGHQP